MSPGETNRLLGIAFLAIGLLQIFSWYIGFIGVSSFINFGLMNIFAVSIIFYPAVSVVLIIAGFGIPRVEAWAKRAGLTASVPVLLITPVGTIAGIFGIWFFTSGRGRKLYFNSEENESEPGSIL